jgi:hypothetical protein
MQKNNIIYENNYNDNEENFYNDKYITSPLYYVPILIKNDVNNNALYNVIDENMYNSNIFNFISVVFIIVVLFYALKYLMIIFIGS